ncbi:MAG: polysaccharide deacetylase family protein [Candidatus Nitrosotenuis sp.]
MKLFAFTLDLEADYGGVVNQYEIFKDLANIDDVLSKLNDLGVRITVFVVGEILELFPETIKIFEKYNCEFEPHSYSHDFNNPDSESEIEKSKLAYFNYFKRYPAGYRAPRGKISESGIKLLEKHGFLYDSSIFPSYFPNPFRYLFSNRKIHYYGNSKIVEIPLTSVSPIRITLSASFIKLFGVNLFKKLSLPNIICFDSHLHDFIINEDSFGKLPLFQKLLYNRNKYRGFDLCIEFIEHVKEQGYKFCYMSEIHEAYENGHL